MSAPQFPDPAGRREVLEPGATAHKAGASEGNRLKALEQGAASRRMSPESLLSARGDLITRDATGPVRKGLGTVGQVLYSDGTDPQYGNLSLYTRRQLYQAHGFKFGSTGAGTTYILGSDSSTSVASPVSTATTLYTVPILRLDDADYAVTGKTLKLTLDCSIGVNATAPGVNVTFALLPISAIAGAANALSFTYGTALATTVFTTPSASQHAFASTTIDFPADGPYAVGMAFSNNQAANSMVSGSARVYVTWA